MPKAHPKFHNLQPFEVQLHETFDNRIEQQLQLFSARRAYAMAYRRVPGGAINPIEHGPQRQIPAAQLTRRARTNRPLCIR